MNGTCPTCGGARRRTTRRDGTGAYCGACRVWTPIRTAEVGGGLIVLDEGQLDIYDALGETA